MGDETKQDAEKQTIPQLFGENVKKYRKRAGLTQEQLSERLEVTQKHLSIIETGTQFASAALIGKIADALEVTPAMLFGDYKRDVNITEVNMICSLLQKALQKHMNILYRRLDELEKRIDEKEKSPF